MECFDVLVSTFSEVNAGVANVSQMDVNGRQRLMTATLRMWQHELNGMHNAVSARSPNRKIVWQVTEEANNQFLQKLNNTKAKSATWTISRV